MTWARARARQRPPRQEALAVSPQRSPAEEALVQAWREQRAECRPVKFDATAGEKTAKLTSPRNDPELAQALLAHALGTTDRDLQAQLLCHVTSCYWKPSCEEAAVNTSLAALCSIAPRDAVEGLLAVQMLAVHNVAMEQLGRTMIPEQTPEGID